MTSELQMALAHDGQFLNRVQFTMAKVAINVMEEPAGPRRTYALQVLGNPAAAAISMSVGLAGHVNIVTNNTFIDPNLRVWTDTNDAQLFSAVNDLWDKYAGT